MLRKILPLTIFLFATTVNAQQNKKVKPAVTPVAANNIPVSNADLGTFPYFKTLPNFYATDSLSIEQNRSYFFDGNNYLAIDGPVSSQKLNVRERDKKVPSEFQIVQEFDKVVSTLGGIKIYAGKLPEEPLKKIANGDLVDLGSKHQVAPSAFYGVVEYVIKTPQKEVWIQLQPSSIGSSFYTILIAEKQSQLPGTNINKENILLQGLEKNGKGFIHLDFGPDSSVLLSQSKDELLSIVGIFQSHPDWKIKMEVHNAPVGTAGYILGLTEKRAAAIKAELVALGVKPASLELKGLGDTKPLVSNDTETGRQTNTRVDVYKL